MLICRCEPQQLAGAQIYSFVLRPTSRPPTHAGAPSLAGKLRPNGFAVVNLVQLQGSVLGPNLIQQRLGLLTVGTAAPGENHDLQHKGWPRIVASLMLPSICAMHSASTCAIHSAPVTVWRSTCGAEHVSHYTAEAAEVQANLPLASPGCRQSACQSCSWLLPGHSRLHASGDKLFPGQGTSRAAQKADASSTADMTPKVILCSRCARQGSRTHA